MRRKTAQKFSDAVAAVTIAVALADGTIFWLLTDILLYHFHPAA